MNEITGKISEIFSSVQGEGPYQGARQLFIRFYGCNLSCRFCDTFLDSYTEYTAFGLLQKIPAPGDFHSISLTGGEPLLQAEFLQNLLPELKRRGHTVYLETNGIIFEELKNLIPFIDIIAMDFKLSSSTGLKDFWYEHREFLKVALSKEAFVKAVICEATLSEDIRIAIALLRELKKDMLFILQPEYPNSAKVAVQCSHFEKMCRQMGINARIVAQLHKALGVP